MAVTSHPKSKPTIDFPSLLFPSTKVLFYHSNTKSPGTCPHLSGTFIRGLTTPSNPVRVSGIAALAEVLYVFILLSANACPTNWDLSPPLDRSIKKLILTVRRPLLQSFHRRNSQTPPLLRYRLGPVSNSQSFSLLGVG